MFFKGLPLFYPDICFGMVGNMVRAMGFVTTPVDCARRTVYKPNLSLSLHLSSEH